MHWWLLACSGGPPWGPRDHGAELAYKYGASPGAQRERHPTGRGKTEATWEQACGEQPEKHCVDLAAVRIAEGKEADQALGLGCAAKDPLACKHLGYRSSDPLASLKALERACELGSGMACQSVGFRRYTGKDRAGALEAWKKGCVAGYDKSCFEAAVALEERRDVQQAARYFHYACTMGYPRACQELSRFYTEEIGVRMDLERAGFLACRECELEEQQTHRKDLGYPPGSVQCRGMEMLSRQRPESWVACSLQGRR